MLGEVLGRDEGWVLGGEEAAGLVVNGGDVIDSDSEDGGVLGCSLKVGAVVGDVLGSLESTTL